MTTLTTTQTAAVLAAWKEGLSTRQIARQLGVCGRTAIQRVLAEHGISRQRTLEERFVLHVLYRLDGCWGWTRKPAKNGYSYVSIADRDERLAHRVAYELYRGPIPTGLTLDHKCRNRWCVNPWHTEPETHRVNILLGTGASARNAVKTHCLRGHAFTSENTGRYQQGRRTCRACARQRQRDRRAA